MTIKTTLDILNCKDEAQRDSMVAKLPPRDAKDVLRYVLRVLHEQVQTSPHNSLEK